MVTPSKGYLWRTSVVILSLALILVALPHTLEDFSQGEPAKHGAAAPVLAEVVAGLFAAQGWALFELGRQQRRGYLIHAVLGILWPLAAGSAQLPVIFTGQPYRAGLISLFYVFGMISLGLLLLLASLQGWRTASPQAQ
jgi:hypothetical protein